MTLSQRIAEPVFHALVSPQGYVELNALFTLGERAVSKLENGKWYTAEELNALSGGGIWLKDHPQSKEKNIKKWRYERQTFAHLGAATDLSREIENG